VGKTLYVGNLPFELTQEELQRLFSEAGTCESATVIFDRITGRPRGFGFVEMASVGEAQTAIEQFDGREVKGRPLRVNEARERQLRGSAESPGRRSERNVFSREPRGYGRERMGWNRRYS
jgi:RNA recognition motif-containing protein